MVDFNNETTVTRNKKEILIFLIIEMRHYVIESIELYKKQSFQNAVPNAEAALRARINTLFLYIRSSLKKDLEETDFNKIKNALEEKEFDSYVEGFYLIDKYLYDKDVTRFYSTRDYDASDPLAEDEAKGI